jgi:hypothetical protein
MTERWSGLAIPILFTLGNFEDFDDSPGLPRLSREMLLSDKGIKL